MCCFDRCTLTTVSKKTTVDFNNTGVQKSSEKTREFKRKPIFILRLYSRTWLPQAPMKTVFNDRQTKLCAHNNHILYCWNTRDGCRQAEKTRERM